MVMTEIASVSGLFSGLVTRVVCISKVLIFQFQKVGLIDSDRFVRLFRDFRVALISKIVKIFIDILYRSGS